MNLVHLSYATLLLIFIPLHILAIFMSYVFQVHDSVDESHDKAQSQPNLQQISSQFHEALRMDPIELGNDIKVC